MSGSGARKTLTLVTGGARSGKSSFALALAGAGGRVLFAATAEAGDGDMAARIAAHRAERPAAWTTLEAPVAVAAALRAASAEHDLVVVDCLTLWVSNMMLQPGAPADDAILREADDLLLAYREGSASWIVVTNEVGLGVVPPSALGRRYRDLLGRVNQRAAAAADAVYLVVSGLALELRTLGARPAVPPDACDAPVAARAEGDANTPPLSRS